MKHISLNTFGGRFFDQLMEFVTRQSAMTDVFCFQEVLNTSDNITVSQGHRANLFSELTRALPDFHGFFAPAQSHFAVVRGVSENIDFGLATFVKKIHTPEKVGDFFIYSELGSFVLNDFSTLPCNLLYVQFKVKGRLLTVCNAHGTSCPTTKRDSQDRLNQTQKILEFVGREAGEKLVAGDFNLFPDTRSIQMFEENGFRNLVKDFSITTTRGSLVKKLHPEFGKTPEGWHEFADYTFVSSGILPKSFTVPDLAISDHLPLILEFDFLRK